MKYSINFNKPLSHLINITLQLERITSDFTQLNLPIWRPGRYEAANYSKNILGVTIYDDKDNNLSYAKPNANQWLVESKNTKRITVKYQYYAHALDAGNSWYDEELVYLNFINCLMYVPNRITESCEVFIQLPNEYKVACALRFENSRLNADDYYQLVDSPLMASEHIQNLNYEINKIPFHIWIHGKHNLNTKKLVADFEKFSVAQINLFDEFPESAYHFLIIAPPYKHYHGVEHAASTVICIGPGDTLVKEKMYQELLGVSSHELFHAWNIIKIRPKEMMPYDFGKEVTFPTGYVAEGFTTYYGDLYLCRSGVFGVDWYLSELNTLFNRHFWNYGRLNESVVTSSTNLWVDGYIAGSPNKKSSIYIEGAMIALCLDLLIRKKTKNKKSLDDLMQKLWAEHGQNANGYSLKNIQQYSEEIANEALTDFFNEYVYGTVDKTVLLVQLLKNAGCELALKENENVLMGVLGIKTIPQNNCLVVIQIVPNSIGEIHFSLKDEIKSINGISANEFKKTTQKAFRFNVLRNSNEINFNITGSDSKYFMNHNIIQVRDKTKEQQVVFNNWLGQG